MKDKVLQLLKTKYSNLGLSVKTLEGFAEQLATNITEESQIEGAVQGAEFYLKIAQGEADRARQEAKKNNTPQQQPTPETPKPETTDDTPEWAKGLKQTIDALTTKVSTLEAEKSSTSRRSLLEQKISKADPILKAKILKDFSRMNFETEDQFNEYLTETETDVSTLVQDSINKGLSETKPILGGAKNKDGISSSTAEYIEMTTKAQTETVGKPLFNNI